jgi:hypothetical protein
VGLPGYKSTGRSKAMWALCKPKRDVMAGRDFSKMQKRRRREWEVVVVTPYLSFKVQLLATSGHQRFSLQPFASALLHTLAACSSRTLLHPTRSTAKWRPRPRPPRRHMRGSREAHRLDHHSWMHHGRLATFRRCNSMHLQGWRS